MFFVIWFLFVKAAIFYPLSSLRFEGRAQRAKTCGQTTRQKVRPGKTLRYNSLLSTHSSTHLHPHLLHPHLLSSHSFPFDLQSIFNRLRLKLLLLQIWTLMFEFSFYPGPERPKMPRRANRKEAAPVLDLPLPRPLVPNQLPRRHRRRHPPFRYLLHACSRFTLSLSCSPECVGLFQQPRRYSTRS